MNVCNPDSSRDASARTCTMARRTKAEAAATREALLDAAERVFRERGVAHTSLAEVAAAAGRDARRRLLALPRQGRPVRGAVRARAAADGGDARERRRKRGSRIRSARCARLPSTVSRCSRPTRARRRCSTSSSTNASSPPSSPPSPSARHATDSGCLVNVERLLKQAVRAGQLAADADTRLARAVRERVHRRRDARVGRSSRRPTTSRGPRRR